MSDVTAVCRDPDEVMAGSARAETVLANCRHILARYRIYAHAHYGMRAGHAWQVRGGYVAWGRRMRSVSG